MHRSLLRHSVARPLLLAAALAPLRLTSNAHNAIVWEIPCWLDSYRCSLPRVATNLLTRRLLLLAAPLG